MFSWLSSVHLAMWHLLLMVFSTKVSCEVGTAAAGWSSAWCISGGVGPGAGAVGSAAGCLGGGGSSALLVVISWITRLAMRWEWYSSASCTYLFTASEPHLPSSWMVLSGMRALANSCAPATLRICWPTSEDGVSMGKVPPQVATSCLTVSRHCAAVIVVPIVLGISGDSAVVS